MTDAQIIKQSCERFISYRYPTTARQELLELANAVDPDIAPDVGGTGELADNLETRVATLLGKPSAVFMPSGKTAQLIALRLWCESSNCNTLAVHMRSHIEEFEEQSHRFLHGLQTVPLGHANRQTTLKDIEGLNPPIGAVSIELPLRNLGWLLPAWSELEDMSKALADKKIPFHADAARLWELQPYYDRSFVEIAKLFDSLYVSFYKGIGALAGAALVGPADLIDEAKVWQQRTGTRLPKMHPYLIGALHGLDTRLPLMPDYYQKAKAICEALQVLPDVSLHPEQPHGNSFHVVIRGDVSKLEEARNRAAEETGIWPFDVIVPSPITGFAMFELVIQDAALDLSDAEIADCIGRVARYMAD